MSGIGVRKVKVQGHRKRYLDTKKDNILFKKSSSPTFQKKKKAPCFHSITKSRERFFLCLLKINPPQRSQHVVEFRLNFTPGKRGRSTPILQVPTFCWYQVGLSWIFERWYLTIVS